MGGAGRQVLFRARRYRTEEVAEREQPALIIDDISCEPHDLSMNGLCFFAPPGAPSLSVGQEVTAILRSHDRLVYKGNAIITRMERDQNKRQRIAGRITTGFLDIPKLAALHEQFEIQESFQRGTKATLAAIPWKYKELCTEIVFFLKHYRQLFARYQRHHDQHGELADPDLLETVRQSETRFRGKWNELRQRANECVSRLDDDSEVRLAMKQLTECLITSELVTSPGWRRLFEKPLGYPGDYVMMNYFYSRTALGDTPYERLLHKLILDHPRAVALPYRLAMFREMVVHTVEQQPLSSEAVRVTSLGCGPARELQDFLEIAPGRRPMELTLIDQDERALSYAYGEVFRRASQYSNDIAVGCLHVSFAQLVRAQNIPCFQRPDENRQGEHLIYVAGLLDYLRTTAARQLVTTLYQHLAPGGVLAVGNVRAPSSSPWENEFVVDWSLIYRSRDEMARLADDLRGIEDIEISVETEPTGQFLALIIRRPPVRRN